MTPELDPVIAELGKDIVVGFGAGVVAEGKAGSWASPGDFGVEAGGWRADEVATGVSEGNRRLWVVVEEGWRWR